MKKVSIIALFIITASLYPAASSEGSCARTSAYERKTVTPLILASPVMAPAVPESLENIVACRLGKDNYAISCYEISSNEFGFALLPPTTGHHRRFYTDQATFTNRNHDAPYFTISELLLSVSNGQKLLNGTIASYVHILDRSFVVLCPHPTHMQRISEELEYNRHNLTTMLAIKTYLARRLPDTTCIVFDIEYYDQLRRSASTELYDDTDSDEYGEIPYSIRARSASF
jgi:hypothetical protein